jgi:hypothetical protein
LKRLGRPRALWRRSWREWRVWSAFGITKTREDYAVKVNFEAAPKESVPSSIAGVPVQVEVVGKVRKRD